MKTFEFARISIVFLIFLYALNISAAETESSGLSNSRLGSLPYSNQWVFEKPQSYLYLSANYSHLASSTLTVKTFQSSFGDNSFWYPSIDYFSHLFYMSSLESDSLFRKLSVNARYGLGFLILNGNLSDTQTPIQSSVEYSSLLGLQLRLGPQLSCEFLPWLSSYLGEDIGITGYRHSASINGAEARRCGRR